MTTTLSAYWESGMAKPREPQLLLPPVPLALPALSEVAAARKATSTWTSPAIMARGRPPWERMIAGSFSLPCEMASPIRPRTPEDSMCVMMPCSM